MPTNIVNVKPWQVFNLSLFESYVVVDCRSSSSFDEGHIVSSLSCPFPPEGYESDSSALFDAFFEVVADVTPENFSPIVLVHDGAPESQKFAEFLGGLISSFLDKPLLASSSENTGAGRKGQILRQFVKCKEVWLLDYCLFLGIFPFYCDPAMRFTDLTPSPRYISPELIACTRGCNISECVAQFNITHIITHEDALLGGQVGTGVSIISYSIEDRFDQDLSQLWTSLCQCMMQVKASSGRMLLRIRGRAITSSCAAAYLIASGWSLDDALSHCSTAYALPNIMKESELREWASHTSSHAPSAIIPRIEAVVSSAAL